VAVLGVVGGTSGGSWRWFLVRNRARLCVTDS